MLAGVAREVYLTPKPPRLARYKFQRAKTALDLRRKGIFVKVYLV